MNVKFEKHGSLPDGEALYRMWLDGDPVREGLTLDEVIRSINRRDEETMLPLPVAEEGSTVSPQPRQWRAASEAGPGLATRQGEQESLGERHVPGGCIR